MLRGRGAVAAFYEYGEQTVTGNTESCRRDWTAATRFPALDAAQRLDTLTRWGGSQIGRLFSNNHLYMFEVTQYGVVGNGFPTSADSTQWSLPVTFVCWEGGFGF